MSPVPEPQASLPFDMAERLAALEAGILEALGGENAECGVRNAECEAAGEAGEREIRLLDVGGAPGIFARRLEQRHPGWRIAIVDLFDCYADRYVKGSGLALPFRDAAFDAVYCCDVLEHIPASNRRRFLSELSRVSRGGVVIAAPFKHPNVDRAEEILNDLHREVFGAPHPWLWEHRECGLPDLAETIGELERDTRDTRDIGDTRETRDTRDTRDNKVSEVNPVNPVNPVRALRIAARPNADLERWFLLQLVEILSRVYPGARDAWAAFQDPLGAHWNDPDAPIAGVPYRWILVASNRGAAVLRETPVAARSVLPAIPLAGAAPVQCSPGASGFLPTDHPQFAGALHPHSARLDARLHAMAGLARALATSWKSISRGADTDGGSGATAQAELIARLTSVVEFQQKELERAGAPSQKPSSIFEKALRKIRR